MANERAEILAKILNLCESNPDAGLEFIEQTMKESPEAATDPFGKFAKAMAYGSKGLFQLARSKPEIDFSGFDKEELRDELGITDSHLDYLEKGLHEIEQMEEIYPGASKMFDKMGEVKVDTMALVLERCRPGRVQQILGKTKLKYFGPQRVTYLSGSDIESMSPGDFQTFADVFFTFPHVIRTALLAFQGEDSKGRKYVHVLLFERTPDDALPGETIEEQLGFKGGIYLFDDGTFGKALPEESSE
ncbi:MAG: hypothetical protein QW304_08935 [Thermoproteota archaeon]